MLDSSFTTHGGELIKLNYSATRHEDNNIVLPNFENVSNRN
jgi:hypothetical protein